MPTVMRLVKRFDAVPAVDRAPLRRLAAPAGRRLRWATLLQLLASALAVVPLVGIWLIADAAITGIVDDAAVSRPRVHTGIALVAVASVLAFALTCAAYHLSHTADLRVRRSVRLAIADLLGRLPLGWFGSDSSTKALSALGQDVEALHTAVAHGRMELIQAVVTPVPIVVWLFVMDWRLAIVVLIPTIVNYALQQRIIKRAQQHQAEQGAAVADLTGAATEELRDAVTVRVTPSAAGPNRLQRAAQRLHRVVVDSHLEQESRGSRIATLVDPVFGLTLVLAVGVPLLRYSTLTASDLVAFAVSTVLIAAAPASITTARWGMVSAAMAAGRLEAFLGEPCLPVPETPEPPEHGGIAFRSVTFGHGDGAPVLSDVTLTIAPNSYTAVVGPSGSGKSTLCSLIGRHHDVDQGSVLVGGVDVRKIDPVELARLVALLPQRALLLRTTVRDNIRLGRPDATDETVIRAARAAHVHDRIMRLPNGYDTVVGDGLSLSSGESQRVAIARALLADPPILILDEPTAHVDPESAAAIHASLAEIARGRTVILVAHQLETVRDADRIVVIRDGRVSAQGTHDELLADGGLYSRLWEAMPL